MYMWLLMFRGGHVVSEVPANAVHNAATKHF